VLNIRFFARIREQLEIDRLQLPVSAATSTVSQLVAHLVNEHGSLWDEVLNAPNVITAVNQAVTDSNHSLSDGDEVAFFPPVTGG
jgi:molybdopterin synthase sulfur carrier subunit